jgi:hypothetical protein
MQTVVILLAIAYLPGAVILRLPLANRPSRASLPAEERVYWAVIVSITLTTTLAFALAALASYTIERLTLLNLLLTAGLAAAYRGRLRWGPEAAAPTLTAIIPLGLIALGWWMYFAVPPAEYVIGGRDPGVYLNEGVQIAQRRSLITVDELAASVPDTTRDLFFPAYGRDGYYSVRYMGFHLRDPQSGTVSGQFPQGYPVWIAIAYGLDGVSGTRTVIAWWAILGTVAVYFAAARLIGPLPAAAAAGLLSVHVIQTWYARYPNSEIVTQTLLFAGLLAHAYAHEDRDRFFAPIAASLLGLAFFTRLPAVLAIATAIAASLLARNVDRRARAAFLVTLGAWLAAGTVYYTTQLRPYFNRPVAYLGTLDAMQLAAIAAGAAAFGLLLWAIRLPQVARATHTWLPRALVAILAAGALYALLLRVPGGRLAPHDAHALRAFADLYFTRLALLLAVIGYALLLTRSFWRAPALLLTISALSLFFFYKMRIWPENFWLARRFLTEILPGGLICTAAAVFAPVWYPASLDSMRMARPVFAAIGVAATLMLGQHYLSASQPIRTHVEYAGIIPRLEQLAATFGDDDLVVFESRRASDVHVLALPLSYIYARNVLVLAGTQPDKPSVARFLEWAGGKYRNIYFVAGGGTDLLSADVGSVVVRTERFQVPEYEKTAYDTYPRRPVMKPFDFTIYRLVKASSTQAPESLDVGGTDDLHLIDFYPKERLGGGPVTFRWSQDTSTLLMRMPPQSRELVLRLSGGRPRGVPPAQVTILVDGTEIGRAGPSNDFREHVFAIPAALAAAAGASDTARIEIRSTTWSPRSVAGGSDTRALGVMVDRAEIR